jgi:hypothetical protein
MNEALRNRLLTDISMTVGEVYSPAMSITTKKEADEYFKVLVDRCMTFAFENKNLKMAIDTVKSNLGYYAGYYDHKTRERVEHLFNCEHPVLGKAIEHQPSEECFEAGKRMMTEYLKDKKEVEMEKLRVDKKTYWDWVKSDE